MSSLESLRAGELAGSRRLQLACGLREFPREIFDLADSLEVLDLSGNQLESLPDDLHRLQRLRILFCSGNRFTRLPEALGACARLEMVGFKSNRIDTVPGAALPPELRWLILTDNRIESLPAQIGHCHRLQKLMLAGNRLASLPVELAACTRLELLRIAANRLESLPAWLPAMPRLAWLAFAGNPFCAGVEASGPEAAPVPAIAWTELELHERLGEGASGVIHRADWRQSGASQPVAVKLFKGAVTSDGLPRCEMAACLGAGGHPALMPVLGRVAGHPDGAAGLVMPLVDAGFANLAGPPSLESCTRDVYPADAAYALPTVLGLAAGIASAAAHLHGRGIMHGDLYAHNILHCGGGRGILGDFGAASRFDPADRELAAGLERIEMRAFACLLDELLARLSPEPETAMRQALAHLARRCTDAETPLSFAELACALAGLAIPAAGAPARGGCGA